MRKQWLVWIVEFIYVVCAIILTIYNISKLYCSKDFVGIIIYLIVLSSSLFLVWFLSSKCKPFGFTKVFREKYEMLLYRSLVLIFLYLYMGLQIVGWFNDIMPHKDIWVPMMGFINVLLIMLLNNVMTLKDNNIEMLNYLVPICRELRNNLEMLDDESETCDRTYAATHKFTLNSWDKHFFIYAKYMERKNVEKIDDLYQLFLNYNESARMEKKRNEIIEKIKDVQKIISEEYFEGGKSNKDKSISEIEVGIKQKEFDSCNIVCGKRMRGTCSVLRIKSVAKKQLCVLRLMEEAYKPLRRQGNFSCVRQGCRARRLQLQGRTVADVRKMNLPSSKGLCDWNTSAKRN